VLEAVELRAQGRDGAARLEVLEGYLEQRVLELDGRAVLDALVGERRMRSYVFIRQQPVRDESLGADEQGVSGEGREALIGRVAVARGAEREHLPEVLARVGEEVDEVVAFGPEVADA